MKTLYINISGENIQSKDDIVVVGKPTDDLANKFYFELANQILKGVIAPSVKNKRELITEFMQQHKDVYEEKILPQLDHAKHLMLSSDLRGEVKVQLPQEYIQWLNYYGTADYSAIAKSLNGKGGIVTINLSRIYRNGIQLLINGIEPGDYGQLVVNDDAVEDDTEMVVAIRERLKNPMLPFIPYSEFVKEEKVCPKCGKYPCECIIGGDSVGQKLFIVFKEETGGTIYGSMSHKEWGLYNIHGEMCLPMGLYEQIYNSNYPECFEKAFNWFKQKDGQSYYYLSEDKCIMLGEFADATPLNEQYLAVKKNEDSEFSCVIDSDGKEVIPQGRIGRIEGITVDGYILCEIAPNCWGTLHMGSGKEYSLGLSLHKCEMNPQDSIIYLELYQKGKKNSRITEYFEPCSDSGLFCNNEKSEAFCFVTPSIYGKKDRFVCGDEFYSISRKKSYYFEGIHDDIAYRNVVTNEDKNDYGFVHISTSNVYSSLQIIFKIENYCIVAKKDPDYKNSRRCDQIGIVNLNSRKDTACIGEQDIFYLSQFADRPIFLLGEENTLTLFDPRNNNRVQFNCSYWGRKIMYSEGVINVIYKLDNGRNALLIFDTDGNTLYHDKWGALDVNSSEEELTPCFHTFENGQLKELPRDYSIVKTGETMGVIDSSGNNIVPNIYGDVKLFRPLNSYCRENGIAVFMDNWDIIDKFII